MAACTCFANRSPCPTLSKLEHKLPQLRWWRGGALPILDVWTPPPGIGTSRLEPIRPNRALLRNHTPFHPAAPTLLRELYFSHECNHRKKSPNGANHLSKLRGSQRYETVPSDHIHVGTLPPRSIKEASPLIHH